MIPLIGGAVEINPKMNDATDYVGIFEHSNSIYMVCSDKSVICLDMLKRKWVHKKPTLKDHSCPGCLVTTDK